jgi:hypothetical protein
MTTVQQATRSRLPSPGGAARVVLADHRQAVQPCSTPAPSIRALVRPKRNGESP